VPKNEVFGGFEGGDVKILSSNPQKALPRREYASVGVLRVKFGSTAWALGWLKDFAYKEILKKLSGNFGYMGRSNPWGDLDQMSLVGRYGGCNHVCNIWWLSVKGCWCVRGVSLPSAIDLTRRPYNTGHYRVTRVYFITRSTRKKWKRSEIDA